MFKALRDVDPATVDVELLASMVLSIQPFRDFIKDRRAELVANRTSLK